MDSQHYKKERMHAGPTKSPFPNFPLGFAASRSIVYLETITAWIPELRM
jgi:hypothetical protein